MLLNFNLVLILYLSVTSRSAQPTHVTLCHVLMEPTLERYVIMQ